MGKVTRHILFAGAYGIENVGDDLPLIVMCEKLKEQAPTYQFSFRVLSRHPNRWEEYQYKVKLIKNLEYESRRQAEKKWFYGFNYGDDKRRLLSVKEEIRRCDLLILGAGNFLIDTTIDLFRGPISLLAVYVFLAKLFHKPVMLYSFSAGPLKTTWGRDLARWIVENSDIVTVRDADSRHLLRKLLGRPKKIYLLPDATIGAEPADQKRMVEILNKEYIYRSKRKKIGIAIRDLSVVAKSHRVEAVWNQLTRTINELAGACEFIFIPQSTYKEDDDRLAAKKFAQRLNKDVIYYVIKNRYHPREILGLYRYFDVVLAMRLHGAVFATVMGKPVMAINYLPKVEGFMKSMRLEKSLINMEEVKKENLLSLLDELLSKKAVLGEKINHDIAMKKKLVNRYATLALSCFKD